MNNFKQIFFDEYKKLGIPRNEVTAEFNMILDYLKIDPLKEIKEGFLESEKTNILKIAKKRAETNIPLQYITGFAYFMGDKFLVNENTLIPRPETEILVRECIKYINSNDKILDIGTGTGCIAVEIEKLTNADVDGIDISSNALKIAKKNADIHNVNINFFQSDLFSNVKKKYDFIISNPPYIPIKEKFNLESNVRDFEPHDALFANDDLGIQFYEKIIEDSLTFLNKNGRLGFELGINQSEPVKAILVNKGFSDIEIIKDFDNIERVIISKKI